MMALWYILAMTATVAAPLIARTRVVQRLLSELDDDRASVTVGSPDR